jgi:hypothetical protein
MRIKESIVEMGEAEARSRRNAVREVRLVITGWMRRNRWSWTLEREG